MSERGSYTKGRARREEILRTALEVLSVQGYRNTSLRGIGRELGLQPAHILHYFPSKEALLEAIITAWDAQSEVTLESSGGSFLEVWPDINAHNAEVPGLLHLYTAFAAEAADENHPSRAYFQARFESVRGRIERELDAHQADGSLDPAVDTRRLAIRLIAFSDGLQLQWLIDPTIDMPGELREVIAEVIRPA